MPATRTSPAAQAVAELDDLNLKLARGQRMLRRLKDEDVQIATADKEVVFREDKTTLYRYKSTVKRTRAVLEQGRALFCDRRLEERVILVFAQRRPFDERDVFIQHAAVSCRRDVMRRHIGEPDPVVGDACANAAAGFRQPPVLYIAFGKLA